ncbi:hypothetical protein ACHQM5_004153 [Ranunculus cassubicifolius]
MSTPPPINTNPTPKISSSLHNFLFTSLSIFFLVSSSKPHNLIHSIPTQSFHQSHRRPHRRLFLKNPIMSNPNSNPFSSPKSLFDWLQPRLPKDSFTSWGTKPGTKNIHNLWLEISEGESSLIDSADSILPVRTVHVVIVCILNKNGERLVEAYQEMSDGTIRERFRPLSEKMKPGESVEVAAVRGVKEELGSILGEDVESVVKIVEGSYVEKVEEKESSMSYPGLPGCYVLHSVEAVVEGLPNEDFCTEEGDEYGHCDQEAGKAVSVKKHFWKWVDVSSTD